MKTKPTTIAVQYLIKYLSKELENERQTSKVRDLRTGILFWQRKHRLDHPEGNTDSAGRWYPKGRDEEIFSYHLTPSGTDHVRCCDGESANAAILPLGLEQRCRRCSMISAGARARPRG